MPRPSPSLSIASYVYCEQDGVKRHDGGVTREMVDWYSLISPRANLFIVLFNKPGLGEQYADRFSQFRVGGLSRRHPGNQHYIPTRHERQPAHYLSQPSLYPVPDYSATHFTADDEAVPGDTSLAPYRLQHDQPVGPRATFPQDEGEFLPADQASRFHRHSLPAAWLFFK